MRSTRKLKLVDIRWKLESAFAILSDRSFLERNDFTVEKVERAQRVVLKIYSMIKE